MESSGRAAWPAGVATLRREIEAWRTGKKGGEAMPAALWEAAVALALGRSRPDLPEPWTVLTSPPLLGFDLARDTVPAERATAWNDRIAPLGTRRSTPWRPQSSRSPQHRNPTSVSSSGR
jgi:hypothetical protein